MISYKIFIAAIICVIVVALAVYLHTHPSDTSLRADYEDELQLTDGTYDDAAANTLNTIDKIKKPTAADVFTRGGIIERNILVGDMRNAAQRDDLFNGVIDNYNEALRLVAEEPHDNEHNHMLDNIADFVINQGDLFQDQPDNEFWEPVIPTIFNLTAGVDNARASVVGKNKAKSAREAKNKKDFAKKYVSNTTTHTSDTQNVHDSSVVNDFKHTLDKLPYSRAPNETIDHVRARIISNRDNMSSDKYSRVLMVLKNMSTRNVSTYDRSEKDIFASVWERADAPENRDNAENIREAIINALYDCSTGALTTVCTVGRVSNYLGALAVIDADPTMGTALTLEQYKNEILEECVGVLNAHIDKCARSDDADLRAVAASYTDLSIDVPQPAQDKFNTALRTKINKMANRYTDRVRKPQLDNIIHDCYIASGIV